MTKELWIAVFSSSVLSGILGAIIAGWVNLRSKRNDYVNDYYKLVIERRLAAQDEVERLILQLKIAVIGDDGLPYHFIFAKTDDRLAIYQLLYDVMTKALWLSNDLFEITRELNVLIYTRAPAQTGLIEFGKENYIKIAELRTKLENLHARDMLTLHRVPSFLKSKKSFDSYSPLPRRQDTPTEGNPI
jgi:hypothetical protein